MKNKLTVLVNALSILMIIGAIPLFVLWCVFINWGDSNIFLCIWSPLFAAGVLIFSLTIKKSIHIIKNFKSLVKECVKIKAKKGTVFINDKHRIFKYKKITISLDDILEYQLVNNQTVIQKSGVGESLVGGMLFGGSGAIAGAMVGKKQKLKDDFKVFIKTKNIQNAGIVISLKIDNAYKLYQSLNLLMAQN